MLELLVAIASITNLAAMLLPTLAMASAKADQMSYVKGMKQMRLAAIVFGDENHEATLHMNARAVDLDTPKPWYLHVAP